MFACLCFLALSLIPPLLAQTSHPARALIYSATQRFRHDSIPTAIESLKNAGHTINVEFDNTEDQSLFTDQNLSRYDAIVFLSNTGEVLDEAGKTAFQKYLNSGGNFVGIHSASDCLVNTTFYGRELGAYFDYHANLQEAIVNIVGPSHPSTDKLPRRWQVRDEWYNFKSDPRRVGATVILSVDESTYADTGVRKFDQGNPHPTAWFQDRGAGVSEGTAGRSFYTSLGHLNETWQDEVFMGHVLGGILWALQSNTTRAFNASALVGNAESTTASASTHTQVGVPTTASGANPPSSSPSGNIASSVAVSSLSMTSLVITSILILVSCFMYSPYL